MYTIHIDIYGIGYTSKVHGGELREEQTSICTACQPGCKACLHSASASSGLASPSGRWYNPNPWYISLLISFAIFTNMWLNSLCGCLLTSTNSSFLFPWEMKVYFLIVWLENYVPTTSTTYELWPFLVRLCLIENFCFMNLDLNMMWNSLIEWFTGTTKVKNLENNIGSLAVKLTQEDLKEICDAVPINEVGGERDLAILSEYNWKNANTPSKWLQIVDMKTKAQTTEGKHQFSVVLLSMFAWEK